MLVIYYPYDTSSLRITCSPPLKASRCCKLVTTSTISKCLEIQWPPWTITGWCCCLFIQGSHSTTYAPIPEVVVVQQCAESVGSAQILGNLDVVVGCPGFDYDHRLRMARLGYGIHIVNIRHGYEEFRNKTCYCGGNFFFRSQLT